MFVNGEKTTGTIGDIGITSFYPSKLAPEMVVHYFVMMMI